MKTEYIVPVLGVAGYLAYSGFLPLWASIGAFASITIYFGAEAARMFRGGYDGPAYNASTGVTFEKTASTWVQYLYNRESAPVRANWNCKNCGGPNINQVKCEYCGMVKE